jgi:hypothetical protein
MREELQRLLADFSYDTALKWFVTHVPGKYFIKELLSKGEDQYNRTKLIEELRMLDDSFPKLDIASAPARELSAVTPGLVAKAAPTLDLAMLDQEWKPKYKEANHYFERLEFLQTEEERKEAAFKILDLMDEVEQLWKKKDFVQKYGESPDFEDQGIESLTVAQMVQRINTLRSYISKANKGKLSKDKIPNWESEKAELERRVRG